MKTFESIVKFHLRENNDDPIIPLIEIKIEIILKGTTDIALKVIKHK